MHYKAVSIRPFIGCENFEVSRNFYRDLGFEETVLFDNMSVFKTPSGLSFYLQNAYVKDWIDNTMLFLEVDDVQQCYNDLLALNLSATYKNVRLSAVKKEDWGSECFLHDPSGVLWHFGQFS